MSSMFKTRRKPADTPFIHGPDCKFTKIAPAWSYIGDRQWERACRCHTERQTVLDEAIDPASAMAAPDWREHEHAAGCEATAIEAVIRVEKREGHTGWRTICAVCHTTSIYYLDEFRVDKDGRSIDREGPVRYRYRTRQPVGV